MLFYKCYYNSSLVCVLLIVIFCLQTHIRRHRTDVFVMIVTEELPEWEDSLGIGEVSCNI
jgi:hypothetical protein